MPAATPKETPVASAKKSLSNLKQKLVGPLPVEYLPAEPLSPPTLRTNTSVPVLRDKTSIPRLQPPLVLSRPRPLPLSPRAANDSSVMDGPRFMSMEEADEVDGTEVIPRSKHYVVRVKMPTVWGVPPSRKKRRRKAPPRDPRPLRIIKFLRRQPEGMKRKCKGVFRGIVQKAMAKRLDGCIRALQTEAIEEQSPVEDVEDKPLYRLRERKRRSILHGLTKPKRPLSFASVMTISSKEDRRRYSDVSMYSRRMSTTAGLPTQSPDNAPSSCEVNNEEDPSHRLSLVPFREWWSFMHPRNNPFTDNSSTADRHLSLSSTKGISASKQAADTIHNEQEEAPFRDSFHSLFAIPSSSFSTRPTSQTLPPSNLFRSPSSSLDSSESHDESQAPPSPTSSELTITPSRFSYAQSMSEHLQGSSKDPVVESMDSKTGAGEETKQVQYGTSQENEGVVKPDSKVNPNALASQESTLSSSPHPEKHKSEVSPKGDFASGDSKGSSLSDKLYESKGLMPNSRPEKYKNVKTELNPKGDLVSGESKGATNESKSYLPRSGQKPYPGLGRGVRAIPEHRSAIPVAVHRQGSGSGGESPPNSSREGNQGGIRALDKTSGSHSQVAHSGPPRPWSPEPIRETGLMSSSSSSGSDYGSDDGDLILQKPKSVFTGEYRTRPSDRFRSSSYGPTLKIAGSADNVIMGPGSQSPAATPVSPPANVKHVERAHTDSPQDTEVTPSGKSIAVQETQSGSPKTERPQMPSGHFPKRDISNRELAVARKPLSRPSLNNLFAASSGSPSAEDTPPVPKVPVSKDGVVHKNSPLSAVKTVDSSTQTRSPQRARAALGMTPEQLSAMLIPLQAHLPPPRTSSLQALSDFPLRDEENSGLQPPAGVQPPSDVQPKQQDESHSKPDQAEYSRLPESKSYRMLDGFRNIFKQKVAGEKTRSKQNETNQQTALLPKEQSVVSIKPIDAAEEKTETPKLVPKNKPRQHGMSWNKVVRNPKTSAKNSPAGSTPISISAPLTASLNNSPLEIHTPSFARPTQSTRTKSTVSGSKPPLMSQEGQHRRVIQSVAASTGSPQRPIRTGVKRPALSGNKRPTISSPQPIVPENEHGKITPSGGDLKKPETSQPSFKDIHACIAKLCNKARDDSTAEQREKYLRLALSLQQSVSNFNGSEKEAEEAQMIFTSKKFDKDAAKTTLFEYFAQVQAQLDEE